LVPVAETGIVPYEVFGEPPKRHASVARSPDGPAASGSNLGVRAE